MNMLSLVKGWQAGVDTTVDWEREYPNDKILRSILGSVSNENEGLPREQFDYYLVRDYNRNDRIGKSYIENNTKMHYMERKNSLKILWIKQGRLFEQKK